MTPAIILAGAHVWENDSFESLCPRALLPIANAPLISYHLDWLKRARIDSIVLCTNDAARSLQAYLQDGVEQGLDIYYYEDHVPRGPAGCSHDALALIHGEHYLVVDSSILPDLDLHALLASHLESGASATIVINQGGRERMESSSSSSPAGIYVFSRRALEQVPLTGYQDIKEVLIQQLHQRQERVVAYPAERSMLRVTGLGSYLAAQGWMLRMYHEGQWSAEGYVLRDSAWIHHSARVDASARLIGPLMLGPDTNIEGGAIVIGPSVIGGKCTIGHQAVIGQSVLWNRCQIGRQAVVEQCLVTSGTTIEAGSTSHGVIRRTRTSEPISSG